MPSLVDYIEMGGPDGAVFSPCRRWRYLLWRQWDPAKPLCTFVGLNPSTADEKINDPTIRRCIGFARDWGYGTLLMTNLFAWRATKPADMIMAGAQAIGPRNNEYILAAVRASDMSIAAWGVHGKYRERDTEIVNMLWAQQRGLAALGVTKDGAPRHPLHLPKTAQPVAWPALPPTEVEA